MLVHPQISPIAFSISPLTVHWYGLAYMAAMLLGLHAVQYLTRRHPVAGLTPQVIDATFTATVLGVILGGRLGYTLFYNPAYYLANPLHILYVWQGGMSFHGGTLGVIAAILFISWRHHIAPVHLADRIVPVIPIGLFLGRCANFINAELYGRPTNPSLPWSMVFPQIDTLPRHPSQLYEAGLEGLLLGLLLYLATRTRIKPWQPVGIFCTGYALARIVVEFFRTPEITHTLGPLTITQGQLLSLPLLALGLYALARSRRA